MGRGLVRGLSIFGLALIALGAALIGLATLTAAPAASLAADLPGRVASDLVPTQSPVALTRTPDGTRTPEPAEATRTPAAGGTPTPLPPPSPTATPTPPPAPTRTPTSGPGPPTLPPTTPSATRTPTPMTCPTSVPPGQPKPGAAVLPTATPTPTPRGVPPCHTATPTPTRPPITGFDLGYDRAPLAMSFFGPRFMQSQPTTDSPPVRLELQYPKRPQTTISDTVSLTVRRNAEGALVATLAPDTANVIATPISVGTPNVPIQQARGGNYSAFAVARLPATSGLTVTLSSPSSEEQPLDRDSITWYWSVVSQASGPRRLRLDLELRYKGRTADVPAVPDEPVWTPEIMLDVREKDAIVLGPLSIPTGNIGQTIISAGLSSQIPLLIAWVRTRVGPHPAPPPAGGSGTEPAPPPRRRRRQPR